LSGKSCHFCEGAYTGGIVIGAGLLLRSFDRLRQVDVGVDPHGVATMLIVAPPARYTTPEKRNAFFDDVTARVAALPGVQAVGLCDCLPPNQVRSTTSLFIDGGPRETRDLPLVNAVHAGANYFGALRIAIVTGRAFTSADRLGAAPVVVVNRALAVKLLGATKTGTEALGKRVSLNGTTWRTVVGVVADVHYEGLATAVNHESRRVLANIAEVPMALRASVDEQRKQWRAADPARAARR